VFTCIKIPEGLKLTYLLYCRVLLDLNIKIAYANY
jgi:hypothetical protein